MSAKHIAGVPYEYDLPHDLFEQEPYRRSRASSIGIAEPPVNVRLSTVLVDPDDPGFASAYPNICQLLRNIEPRDEDLIGIRVRDEQQ